MLTRVVPRALTLVWSVCTWVKTSDSMPSAATSGWREIRASRAVWVLGPRVPVTSVAIGRCQLRILYYPSVGKGRLGRFFLPLDVQAKTVCESALENWVSVEACSLAPSIAVCGRGKKLGIHKSQPEQVLLEDIIHVMLHTSRLSEADEIPRAPRREPSQLLMDEVSELAWELIVSRFVKTVLTSRRAEGSAETAVRRRRGENHLTIL